MLKHDKSFTQIQKISQFCKLYNLENPLIPVMEDYEKVLAYLYECISSRTRFLKDCDRVLEQVCPDEVRMRNDLSKRHREAVNNYSTFYWHDGFYSEIHLAMCKTEESTK